jgi:hypothetical protein
MNFLFNLFGKSPVSKSMLNKEKEREKETEQIKSDKIINVINTLKLQSETIDRRNAHNDNKIQKIILEVKTISSTNENKKVLLKKVMVLLNKKRMLEIEIEKNIGIQSLLEKQICALESNAININATETLKQGNMFLKQSNDKMDINKVEDIIDDMNELHEQSQSISDLFSQQIEDLYNDEDLLSELEKYNGNEKVSLLPPIQSTENKNAIVFPLVPTTKIVKTENDEEKIIRELQISML